MPCFPARLRGPVPAAGQVQQPCLPRAEETSPPYQEEQGKGKPTQELWSCGLKGFAPLLCQPSDQC